MADFLKTEDQVNIQEIVEKLVKQNSKRRSSTEGHYDIPAASCSTADIYASCPELARVTVVPETTNTTTTNATATQDAASGSAKMQHVYPSGQLLAIGHRVATQMLDPSGQQERQRSRVLLDERLRSVGIYHNRLMRHRPDMQMQSVQMQMQQMQIQQLQMQQLQMQQLQGQSEQGGRGDTDPGKRPSM
ncbi:hypothetical protein KR074_007925 [Drosophila pseudoananassae]|nr:hypothetical protein KR074_007925 [Drosophila pseudoananassae]